MPDGRFLRRSIAVNEQLARVSLSADHLFTKLIPHLDVEGRISGNPKLIKSIAIPLRREISERMIPKLLQELGREGLIVWYEADGQTVVAFPRFHNHQRIDRDREAPSRLPSPAKKTRDLLTSNSRPTPDLLVANGMEVKDKEVKERGDAHASRPSWVARAGEDWRVAYGGEPPFGRIGKAFKPLIEKHGEDSTLTAWRYYLSQTEPEYANPQRFAQTYGRWNGGRVAKRGGNKNWDQKIAELREQEQSGKTQPT